MMNVLGIDVTPAMVGLALAAAVAATLYLRHAALGADGDGGLVMLELHPEHVAYMKAKEAAFCAGNFGKGLRCILDFLREEEAATTRKILDEPPRYADGYEAHQIDIHPGQFEYLAETHRISVREEKGAEYAEVSRAARACLDWAMRKEREGDDPDPILYEAIRCLNC